MANSNQIPPAKIDSSLDLDFVKSFESSKLPIAVKGIKGDILYMNEQAKMLSMSSKESIFVSYDKKLPEKITKINESGLITIDKIIELKTDADKPENKFFHIESITLLNKFGLFYGTLFLYYDVTSLVNFIKNDEIVDNFKIFDDMTEMFLRDQFDYIFARETERARRYEFPLTVAVFLFGNLHFFGQSFGIDKLNQVLKSIGGYFKQNLRKSDIMFRMDFNDFICILPHTNFENGSLKFKRLADGLSEILKFPDNIRPYLKFGISELNLKKHYESYNSMLEEAKGDLEKRKS